MPVRISSPTRDGRRRGSSQPRRPEHNPLPRPPIRRSELPQARVSLRNHPALDSSASTPRSRGSGPRRSRPRVRRRGFFCPGALQREAVPGWRGTPAPRSRKSPTLRRQGLEDHQVLPASFAMEFRHVLSKTRSIMCFSLWL
ncbi:hypothetical protein GQ55_2G106400 [Panicum hallii var. hallii]|uniref:Uncharacterized protein n=1 Tax=Panicum hallii var. hallii TaxID=1504633 RepID=A0A2T7ENL2_9POAL|nr:hypothetical protein GQ55_2G106400 [Panicum hallii var. hallii]